MEVDLAGRVAVFAGYGSALDLAIADALLANGATVETVEEISAERPAAVKANLGRLDILVIGALVESQLTVAAIEAFCRAGADAMGNRGGRILSVVSAVGVIPARGASAASAHAAAIISLTKSLALELGPRGIQINTLAIGAHTTDALLAGRLLSHVPLGRPAATEEIVAAALFLLDPDNSYTTGHVLVVDGGWAAGYARNF